MQGRRFPFLTHQIERGCVYLTPDDIHDDLSEGISRSITVGPDGSCANPHQSVQEVLRYLAQCYGGTAGSYPYWKRAKNVYRIQLPRGLDRVKVINEARYWGQVHKWEFDFFSDDENTYTQPKLYRVRIKIVNFPSKFWHPRHIRQVLSQLGEVIHIDQTNSCGIDRSAIYVWIECIDPMRIPFSSILPFGDNWCEVFFYIMNWDYLDWVPPTARFNQPGENEDQDTAQSNDRSERSNQARRSLLAAHAHTLAQLTIEPSSPQYSSSETDMLDPVHDTPEKKQISHHGSPTPIAEENLAEKEIPLYLLTADRKWQKLDSGNNVSVKVGQFSILMLCPNQKETIHPDNESLITNCQERPSNQARFNIAVVVGQISILQGEAQWGCNFGDWKQNNAHVPSRKSKPMLLSEEGTPPQVLYPPHKPAAVPSTTTPFAVTTPRFGMPTCFNSLGLLNGPLQYTHLPSKASPPYKSLSTESPHQSHTNPLPKPSQYLPPQIRTLAHHTKTMNDDEFIAQFATLSAGTSTTPPVSLPTRTITTQNWSQCALVRVITDKTVQEAGFASTMGRVWGVNPNTEISPLARNIFLAKFVCPDEMERILYKGVWNYRGDAVVLRRTIGPSDLTAPAVPDMEVWTQFHKIPSHAVLSEGVMHIASQLGKPLTEAIEVFLGGNKFYRSRIQMPVERALKGTLQATHPDLGTLTVYLSYERLDRICHFCSKVGHDLDNCPDRLRMERLKNDPKYRDKLGGVSTTKPRTDPWLNNPTLIPSLSQLHQPQSYNQPQNQAHIQVINPPAPNLTHAAQQAQFGQEQFGQTQIGHTLTQELMPLDNPTTDPIQNPSSEINITQTYPQQDTNRFSRRSNHPTTHPRPSPYQLRTPNHPNQPNQWSESVLTLNENEPKNAPHPTVPRQNKTGDKPECYDSIRAKKKQAVEATMHGPPLDR